MIYLPTDTGTYVPSDYEMSAVRQHVKDVSIKVELLKYDKTKSDPWIVIDSLEGNLVNDNFSMDCDSIQRRSYNCTLCVSDHARKINKSSILSEYLVGYDKKIWVDKYIRVYYGIYSMKLKEIIWWRIGTFTYTTASYTFSATECNLSLSCSDIMCNYDGTKNGLIHQTKYDNAVTGESVVGFSIPAVNYKKNSSGVEIKDSNGERIIESHNTIRDSIIATLGMAGITDYYVEDYPANQDLIPYDLDFSGEVFYSTVWTSLRDLYPSWEFFFDVNGKFIWRKIPTGYNQRTIIDDSMINGIYVTENTSNAFTGIYNCTEVWGKTFTLTNQDRYASSSTYSSNVYTINLPLVAKANSTLANNNPLKYLVRGDKIAFKVSSTNTSANPYLKIVGTVDGQTVTLTNLRIVDSGGNTIPAKTLTAGKICVFTFSGNPENTSENYVYLNGQTQAYGYYEETHADCPFSVPNLGYKIIKRITKETLFSDDLCYNQAEYETYQTCAMRDDINLTMVIVPWLEVNQKVEYTSKLTGNTNQYIIKSISWSTLDGTMTMNMYKFREDFEYVYNNRSING